MFEGLLQPMHILIILVVVLFVFGPSRLPKVGQELGKGLRELRKALNGAPEPKNQEEVRKPEDR